MEMNFYSWVLIVAAFISGSVGLLVLRIRPTNASTVFPLLMFSLSIWSLAYGFEVASTGLTMMRFWIRIEYLGIATSPVLWFIFVLQYTGQKKWLAHRNVVILFIIPFITILLNSTNEVHHLYYRAVQVDRGGVIPFQALTPGPGYWLHVAYSYCSLIGGTLLLIHMWLHSPHLYRNQAGIILIGISVPLVANLFYLSGIRPFTHLDMTPFAFTITGLVIAFGLFRYKLLDLMPLARSVLFENLSDGLIVVDTNQRIVDMNPTARKMLKLPDDTPAGQSVQIALAEWPELLTVLIPKGESYPEMTLHVDSTCQLSVLFSPLHDQRNRSIGGMLILSDITDLKKAEDELRRSNEKMEMLLHSMPQGILIIDEKNHRIMDANPHAALMYGAPVERMLGKICHGFVCPAQEGKCPISGFEKGITKSESVLLTAQGEKVPILKTVLPIEIEGEKCIIECFSDISEMKDAESERLEKEKLEATIEMAGAVCHELNQPLMGALGYTELMLMDGDDMDRLVSNAHKTREQVQRMGEITKKLMGITRYKTKKYLDTQIVDIDYTSKKAG